MEPHVQMTAHKDRTATVSVEIKFDKMELAQQYLEMICKWIAKTQDELTP